MSVQILRIAARGGLGYARSLPHEFAGESRMASDAVRRPVVVGKPLPEIRAMRPRNPLRPPALLLHKPQQRTRIMKGIFAWLIGIPIPIIILLYFFDVF